MTTDACRRVDVPAWDTSCDHDHDERTRRTGKWYVANIRSGVRAVQAGLVNTLSHVAAECSSNSSCLPQRLPSRRCLHIFSLNNTFGTVYFSYNRAAFSSLHFIRELNVCRHHCYCSCKRCTRSIHLRVVERRTETHEGCPKGRRQGDQEDQINSHFDCYVPARFKSHV